MENFDQIFTLLAEDEGIGLNTDILETGLLNILALVGILIYTGKDFLRIFIRRTKNNNCKRCSRCRRSFKRSSKAFKRSRKAIKPSKSCY
jgi:hypothetical protein